MFICPGDCVRAGVVRIISLKAAATLEPEPTQHGKPTFVWAYIARLVWPLLTLWRRDFLLNFSTLCI